MWNNSWMWLLLLAAWMICIIARIFTTSSKSCSRLTSAMKMQRPSARVSMILDSGSACTTKLLSAPTKIATSPIVIVQLHWWLKIDSLSKQTYVVFLVSSIWIRACLLNHIVPLQEELVQQVESLAEALKSRDSMGGNGTYFQGPPALGTSQGF